MNPSQLSADDTAAMLVELATMIEADISIRNGLQTMEDESLGSIATSAKRIRHDLESGTSLANAVGNETSGLGEHVTAAAKAGLASNNPGGSLRELAVYLQRESTHRRQLAWAMIYPLVVVTIGYSVLLFSLFLILGGVNPYLDRYAGAFSSDGFLAGFVKFWFVPPLAFLACGVVLWNSDGLRKWLSSITGIGRLGKLSLFCDLAALQLEQGRDLSDAVLSSAEACGDLELEKTSRSFVEAARRGAQQESIEGFPPLLSWTLLQSPEIDGASGALRQLAESYRSRQSMRWSLASNILPGAFITLVGGGMAAAYIYVVLLPTYGVFF